MGGDLQQLQDKCKTIYVDSHASKTTGQPCILDLYFVGSSMYFLLECVAFVVLVDLAILCLIEQRCLIHLSRTNSGISIRYWLLTLC